MIQQAPTLTVLSSSGTVSAPAIAVRVASTTSGTPTGTIELLDGGTPLLTQPVGAGGVTTVALNTLSSGTHALTAVYAGNIDYLASTSAVVTIAGASMPALPGADFSFTVDSPATETISSAGTASFSFGVQWQGATLASPVVMSVAGLPSGFVGTFNPAVLPPGGTLSHFTLALGPTYQSNGRTPLLRSAGGCEWALVFLPGILLFRRGTESRDRRFTQIACGLCLALVSFAAAGCGDRIFKQQSTSTPQQSYVLTVTGTATGADGSPLQHAATVTLLLSQ